MTTYKVRKESQGYVIVRTVEQIGKITTEAIVQFPSKTHFAHKADAVNVCNQLKEV